MDIIFLVAAAMGCVFITAILALGYLIPTTYGHRKVGIALGSVLAVVVLHLIYPEPLQRLFFTKDDASELLKLTGLKILHEFQISENQYNQWNWPSQRLVMNISAQDRILLIGQIKSCPKFIKKGDAIPVIRLADRHFGNPATIGYETQQAIIYKSLIPAQKDNYAPTWLMISVSKARNRLEIVKWYDD
ncbi:hypothetical protein ACN9ML_17465 [Dyadobacter endophyticus]|uniref:hypothetical protein n=1 Tax=Dyadobacter endophyticus TaxID=1749036 RepID=UPI003CF84412